MRAKTYSVTIEKKIGYFGTNKELTAAKKMMKNKSDSIRFSAAKKKAGYGFYAIARAAFKARVAAPASKLKAVVQAKVPGAKVTVK